MRCYKVYFLLLTSLTLSASYETSNSDNQTSYNSIGHTGLIHLPSGELHSSGSVGVSLGFSRLNEFFSIVATPYNWIEASFYYHRPRDTRLPFKKGQYLDKGFNVKLLLFKYKDIDLSIGIDDIAGTGILSKEFIAGTYIKPNYKITLGIGTGAMSKEQSYKNPIKEWRSRPTSLVIEKNSYGSEVDYGSFFKGPIGIFGGVEFSHPKFSKFVFKVETNPYNYSSFLAGGEFSYKSERLRQKKSNINYGVYYKVKQDILFSMSYIKGNTFDLTLVKKFNFNKKRDRPSPSNIKRISKTNDKNLAFYRDILRNLEKDQLYLQSAEIEDNNIKIAIANGRYNSPYDVFDHSIKVTKELKKLHAIDIKNLEVTNVVSGIATSSISADLECKCNEDQISNIKIYAPSNNFRDYDYQTNLNFPEFYNLIKPQLVYRYGDPAKVFAYGVDVLLDSEIKFTENLFITTSLNYNLWNNYNELRDIPDSPYLPHVRTDYVKYLNKRSDLYITNFQLNRVDKIKNDHYFQLSAGVYELMFAGYGFEYYWQPFRGNLSVGMNLYKVRQRDFEDNFKFGEYEVLTGHSNVIYFHQRSGLQVDLSFGKYLAGDKGYTFDLSRKFSSGFEMGAYFTRTNISKQEYGEGSFDKGFYFTIPIRYSNSSTEILVQPLTRDGGAKLKTESPLIGSIFAGASNQYYYFKN
ncbi:YjbH domain-containing protein [Gammaproteobacteria bacterium]|nr:YjbH domain-containing protein [Gammaproteobacteria bacterium]